VQTADVAPITGRRVIFVLEPFSFPSGGVAVIYQHAEILAENGISAYVALPRQPAEDFYGSRARLIIHHGKLPFRRGDIFVIPEGFPAYVKALMATPVKRLMFCQNQYYLPFTNDPGSGFAEFGVHGLIASSQTIGDFFRDVYGLTDIPLIPCAVDPAIYSVASRKRRQVAYMPRKLPAEAAFIQAVFRRRHQRYADIPWVAIDQKTQREAAAVLAESEVFLSLSHKESLGLPPLEAMACGCLVAGFHGDGGREYMTNENGWWAETGDWKASVDGLAAALDLLQAGGDVLAFRRAAMAATVDRYSPARMRAALLAFWRKEIATPFSEDGSRT